MSSVVVIDSRVKDIETLLGGLDEDTRVVLLDPALDGIQQIASTLYGVTNLDAIHILSHGAVGTLYLGSTALHTGNISEYQAELAQIGATLSTDGDILLYGCDVGAGTAGRSFIESLSHYIGADVAASDNATGDSVLRGDWLLEAVTGSIEAIVPLNVQMLDQYAYTLGQTIERVSVADDGTQGNGGDYNNLYPAISGDGRYVAFGSYASNLVPGDTNAVSDIFVYDRMAHTIEAVSVTSGATQANSHSHSPSISSDGRYIAFESAASNLTLDDNNNDYDIFVYDRTNHSIECISTSGVNTGNGQSSGPAISGDGRYVAFTSLASNLVVGDNNSTYDVFVYDRVTHLTERVSLSSDGTQGNDASVSPSIIADGRYVAFASQASNLVTGDTNSARDIFVHDRLTHTTERISIDSNGTQGNASSYNPAMTGDGRYIAFTSFASNLVSADTNSNDDVFVYDRQTHTPVRVSLASDGMQANGSPLYYRPAISNDGRSIVFVSNAANLVAGDTNGKNDVFVHDRSGAAILNRGISGNSGFRAGLESVWQ